MARVIKDHIVNLVHDILVVEAVDDPGVDSAPSEYVISWPDKDKATESARGSCVYLEFQDGPIGEVGVNGISNEALLAVVMDRLRNFQRGRYANKANACALTHIEEAMHWLHSRTQERMRRGVEGTSTP